MPDSCSGRRGSLRYAGVPTSAVHAVRGVAVLRAARDAVLPCARLRPPVSQRREVGTALPAPRRLTLLPDVRERASASAVLVSRATIALDQRVRTPAPPPPVRRRGWALAPSCQPNSQLTIGLYLHHRCGPTDCILLGRVRALRRVDFP